MSIFVLAVGLVSVASLLPVAGLQIQRSTVDDRKSQVGQIATRELKTRGFLRPDNWRYSNNANFCVFDQPTDVGAVLCDTVNQTGREITAPQAFPPVAIDPLIINRFAAKYPVVGTFASNGSASSPPVSMARLTLSTVLGSAADQASVSQDDLAFTIPGGDPDAVPIGGFNSNGTKRAFDGRYSWLATLVPVYGDELVPPTPATSTTPRDPGKPVNRNLMTLSIVVFNQRPTAVAPGTVVNNVNISAERADVATFTGTSIAGVPAPAVGIGAGELQITDEVAVPPISVTERPNLAVNVGEWIMLGTMVYDINAPKDSSGQTQRPFFRWYRVVSAGPILSPNINNDPSNPNRSAKYYARNLTISGPDLNMAIVQQPYWKDWQGTSYPKFWAFIYDGAVAVYERTVRLEGPSMWSN
ncbi:MAG TPA: hypothetical protein VGY55_23045 [Pirellulales bacterium]|jgi:hypothetical protein|nr:hypothetical protein [Pirellulales bacterium]